MLSFFLALMLAAAPAGSPPAKGRSKTPPPPQPVAAPPPAPAPPPVAAPREPTEKEIRTIPIDEKKTNKVYRIRTAIGYPAVIEFPDSFAAPPACGDCGDNGLFRLDVSDEGHYVTIKPRLYPGPQPDGSVIAADEFVTTVTVRLAAQLTLTLQIELAERDKADARVVFTLPDRGSETAYVRAEIAKVRTQLDKDFATRLDAGIMQSFLRALTEPHRCSSSGARVRQDDLVLEAQEVCYFGASIYVRFQVENRTRSTFDVGDVVLKAQNGSGSPTALPDAVFYMPTLTLEFQKPTVGVVGVRLDPDAPHARSYTLTLVEKSGRGRTLNLNALEL